LLCYNAKVTPKHKSAINDIKLVKKLRESESDSYLEHIDKTGFEVIL
jgi:hypothetical protein